MLRSSQRALLQAEDFDAAVTYTWYSDTFNLSDSNVRLTDHGLPYIRISGNAIGDDMDRVHIRLVYTVGAFIFKNEFINIASQLFQRGNGFG